MTVGRLFAPECRYSCRGFVPLVRKKGGGYEAASWVPRVDDGPLLMDLARILATYSPGLHASITPLRMRVLASRVMMRARLRLEGRDLEGYRRVDEGVLDLSLRRGPSRWEVDRFNPVGVNTLRISPGEAYVARPLDRSLGTGPPGRRSLLPPGRHGVAPYALLDVDADGVEDLVTARAGWVEVLAGGRGGYGAPRRLLRQLHVRCLEPADLNGDGWTDLFVGSYGAPSRLILGSKEGLSPSPASQIEGHVTDAAAGDFNGDGFVDLYVVRHGDPSTWPGGQGERDVLLLGGRRIRVEEVGAPGWGLAACVGDLDGDGAPDLWVANESESSWLLSNRRGRLVELSRRAGIDAGPSTACALGDLDGDGRLDLFVGGRRARRAYLFGRPGVGAPGDGVVATRGARRRSARATRGDRLWLNRGARGRLAFVPRHEAVQDTGWTSWAGMVDHDGDGQLDLLVLRRQPAAAVEERFFWEVLDPALRGEQPLEVWGALAPAPTRLWVNLGVGGSRCCRFVDGAAVARLTPAAAALFHDHDGDGAPEVLLRGRTAQVLAWRGEREEGHAVVLELAGRSPNVNAVGSRVALWAGGRRQVREVGSASGLPGGAPGLVHFGVGDAVRVAWIAVRWPDGNRQRFVDLPVDHRVRLTQGGHAAWGERLKPRAPPPEPEPEKDQGPSWTAPPRLLALTVAVGEGTTRPLSHHAGKLGTLILFLGPDFGGLGCEELARLVGRHPGVAGVVVSVSPRSDQPCALTASPATLQALRGGRALMPLLAVVDASGRTLRLFSGSPDKDQLEAVLRGLR